MSIEEQIKFSQMKFKKYPKFRKFYAMKIEKLKDIAMQNAARDAAEAALEAGASDIEIQNAACFAAECMLESNY